MYDEVVSRHRREDRLSTVLSSNSSVTRDRARLRLADRSDLSSLARFIPFEIRPTCTCFATRTAVWSDVCHPPDVAYNRHMDSMSWSPCAYCKSCFSCYMPMVHVHMYMIRPE